METPASTTPRSRATPHNDSAALFSFVGRHEPGRRGGRGEDAAGRGGQGSGGQVDESKEVDPGATERVDSRWMSARLWTRASKRMDTRWMKATERVDGMWMNARQWTRASERVCGRWMKVSKWTRASDRVGWRWMKVRKWTRAR